MLANQAGLCLADRAISSGGESVWHTAVTQAAGFGHVDAPSTNASFERGKATFAHRSKLALPPGRPICIALDASGSTLQSDPGPRFVRIELLQVVRELLTFFSPATSIGYVVFAEGVITSFPPSAANGDLVGASVVRLGDRLIKAASSRGWTSLVAGTTGCARAIQGTGSVVLVSDGVAEGPTGTADEQLKEIQRAIAPAVDDGRLVVNTIRFGVSGLTAKRTMDTIADAGDGRALTAPNGFALLRTGVKLVADNLGVAAGGRVFPIQGVTTIPIVVPENAIAAAAIVIRSTPDIAIKVPGTPPDRKRPTRNTLVVPLERTGRMRHEIRASGNGAVYVATLVRMPAPVVTQAAESPGRPSSEASAVAGANRDSSRSGAQPMILWAAAAAATTFLIIGWLRRRRDERAITTWLSGRRRVFFLADLPLRERFRRRIPASRLFPGTTAVGYDLSVRRASAWLRRGKERIPLDPDIPLVLPVDEAASITFHRKIPTLQKSDDGPVTAGSRR